MLSLVSPHVLEQEVLNAETPVLIGFFRQGKTFCDQIKALEILADIFGDRLKVCLGDEYFLETFFQQFGFSGTPFYLLLSNGRERGRYFGHADMDDLEGLLRDCEVNAIFTK